MKQHQRFGPGLPRRLYSFKPRRMSPPFPRGSQLVGRELRVVDENVRARHEFSEAFVQLGVSRLIVGGVCHRARRRLNAESQAALRMVQPARGDFVFADGERFTSVHFVEFAFRGHHRHVHRKIRYGHLRFEHLLQAVGSQEFRAEAVKLKFVLLHVERRKKRDSLNMIPVVMGDQDVCSLAFFPAWCGPAVAQHAQPCPAIQYEARAVRCFQLQARRVAAVAPRARIHGWRGSAHAPKIQFCNRNWHSRKRKSLLNWPVPRQQTRYGKPVSSSQPMLRPSIPFRQSRCQTAQQACRPAAPANVSA